VASVVYRHDYALCDRLSARRLCFRPRYEAARHMIVTPGESLAATVSHGSGRGPQRLAARSGPMGAVAPGPPRPRPGRRDCGHARSRVPSR
jgi:hypothetical protein